MSLSHVRVIEGRNGITDLDETDREFSPTNGYVTHVGRGIGGGSNQLDLSESSQLTHVKNVSVAQRWVNQKTILSPILYIPSSLASDASGDVAAPLVWCLELSNRSNIGSGHAAGGDSRAGKNRAWRQKKR